MSESANADVLILGTDTNAGKTTFALLWLSAFVREYSYWKPIETGDSDTELIRGLVPDAEIHEPLLRLREPVAPPLAARHEGQSMPTVEEILRASPSTRRPLLIETYGSPFSPLDEKRLQVDLVRALARAVILVSSSSLGAIGRTLQCLTALENHGCRPHAVVLMGPVDDYASEQVALHARISVFPMYPPASWEKEAVRRTAGEQAETLHRIRDRLDEREQDSTTDILEKDRLFIWHPYTPLRDAGPPLVAIGAHDEFLQLANGSLLIDGISSWWTILHGHRHPVLMQALREAAMCFDHVHFAGVTHKPAVELAELLLRSVGWTEGRVFYSDNGSTAVEVALKMAYQFWCHRDEPHRTLFVGFENGYHGDTFGAMAVGRDPVFFGAFEPLLFRAEIVPLDADRLDVCLSRHKGEIAAVIVEPLVQGAGGMRMHTAETLRGLHEVARRHHVLFIADEVMTGGGRTGSLWAHRQAEIKPDLICAAKTLAGGVLLLAATLASADVVQAFDSPDRQRTFFHGHSFTAHPLACSVAVANWKMLTAQSNPAPAAMESFWKTNLDDLRKHPRVRDVRIRGCIAAVELETAGGYLSDVGPKLRQSCLEDGVLLRPLGSVLYAMPPFCTSQNSLERIAAAMIHAVNRTA